MVQHMKQSAAEAKQAELIIPVARPITPNPMPMPIMPIFSML